MRHGILLGGRDDPLAEVWAHVRAAAGATPAYAVGGPVRDLLRGHPHEDADVAVEGDVAELARRLARRLGTPRVTLHGAFGTAVVRRDHVRVDLAATRRERYPHPGSLPVVEPAGIEEDLGRRDFTVNAIAAAISGRRFGEVLDPFDGRTDLDAGAIRILHDGSFHDDPTRLFRAVRYASRLVFTIEPHTDGLAREAIAAGLVDALSGARLRAEVLALLCESTVTVIGALRAADSRGLLAAVGPALAGAGDAAFTGRVLRVDELREHLAPRAPVWRARLAAIAGGAGPAGVSALVERLRLRRRDADVVRAAACAPERLGPRLAGAATPADVADLLDSAPIEATLVVAAAGEAGSANAQMYLERVRGVRLEIDGSVLRDELGLEQSPRVGAVLAALLRRKRNGELADRRSELEAARELVEEGAM